MDKDTIKFRLKGDVSMEDFRTAIDALADLLQTLGEEADPEAPVEWMIEELRDGSATVGARARSDTAVGRAAARTIVTSYGYVWEQAQSGRLGELSPYVRDCVVRLTSMVNGRVTGIEAQTNEDDWHIDNPLTMAYEPTLTVDTPKPSTRTSVKGQVVTLDAKHGVYFALKEIFTNRLVRCYPKPVWMGPLAEHWKAQNWVLVEGTLNRFTTLPTLTDITDIVSLGRGEPGSWRQAFGVAPRDSDGSQDTPTDVVRRIRDAE